MRILGLRVGWFNTGNRRLRKVPSNLERKAGAALLDAALRDQHVLVQILNKYGKLRVPYNDEMETEIQKIRAKITEEAVQTILKDRSHELDSRINKIIDRVMKPVVNTSSGNIRNDLPKESWAISNDDEVVF